MLRPRRCKRAILSSSGCSSTIALITTDLLSRIEDMMAILFPHLFEELEYLLPEEEDVLMTDVGSSAPVNAVAGPSRLG